ncbi:piwi domain protein [Teladorsagia circumcincta]|uniref:Piwi domain protein n=1 Tax=Teladorsagia circumcincta TaxID=45464 RepID=A0A2G9UWF5_TELCI|nr:piwi domain protein [Teladorsagia circumcincta]
MDLITFYYYVLEQVRMYRGSPQTFEKDLKNMAMNQSQRNHFVKRLKGVRVRTDNAIVYDRNGKVAMSRRHGVFEDVLNWPPSRHKMRDGKFMDEVYYYYHERPLRFPHLPLGQIRVGKNTVEVPLEFIYLHEKPQRYLKLMDHNMKAAFIKAVCRKPPDHKRLTDKLLNMMDFNRMPGFINSFLGDRQNLPFPANVPSGYDKVCVIPFHVNPEMIRCKGLILDAPIAIDKDRNPVDMTPLRAIKRKELNEPPNGEIVIAVIIMGVEISRREWQPCVSEVDAKLFYNNVEPIRDEFERYVMDALERLNPEKKLLILVINEEQRTPNSFAGVIKSVCDNKYGVATQVVDASTVKKAVSDDKKTVYYNIALKINAKLGGVNQAVVFDKESNSAEVSPKEAVMYVGIDVTHPTNTSRIDISIASIVANVDLAATRYTNEIMAQMAARETVERFETQFGRLMARFHEDPQLEPTFTYIVIQKRHLTRFYQPGKDEQGQET